MPNLGSGILAFIKAWRLNGFILTGGGTPGKGRRHETEMHILRYANQQSIPVAGVCRGMQVLLGAYGYQTIECQSKHVGQKHRIIPTRHCLSLFSEPIPEKVSSYHHDGFYGLSECPPFIPIAYAEDGSLEAVYCEKPKRLALMWHPEREPSLHPFNRQLFRLCFFH